MRSQAESRRDGMVPGLASMERFPGTLYACGRPPLSLLVPTAQVGCLVEPSPLIPGPLSSGLDQWERRHEGPLDPRLGLAQVTRYGHYGRERLSGTARHCGRPQSGRKQQCLGPGASPGGQAHCCQRPARAPVARGYSVASPRLLAPAAL